MHGVSRDHAAGQTHGALPFGSTVYALVDVISLAPMTLAHGVKMVEEGAVVVGGVGERRVVRPREPLEAPLHVVPTVARREGRESDEQAAEHAKRSLV